RVGRRRDERLEPPFRVRDLAVEARVAQRDRQVLREHLEKLALPRVDRAPGGAVVRDERAERPLRIADRAHDHPRILALRTRRRLGRDRHAVVAQRGLELCRDAGGQLAGIELADDRAGDLAQDRELGDPEGLLDGLAPGGLLELACLGRELPHLLHEPHHLAPSTERPSSAVWMWYAGLRSIRSDSRGPSSSSTTRTRGSVEGGAMALMRRRSAATPRTRARCAPGGREGRPRGPRRAAGSRQAP